MIRRASVLFVVCSLAVSFGAAAGPPPHRPPLLEDGPQSAELREAMHEFFVSELRADLALSDEQAEELIPLLERLEREGRELRREQGETHRRLREALEGGASDGELERLMEQLDRLEAAREELRHDVLVDADRVLNVRQRVELRFFLERFPRMLRDKIREIRGEDAPLDRRPSPPRRLPRKSS